MRMPTTANWSTVVMGWTIGFFALMPVDGWTQAQTDQKQLQAKLASLGWYKAGQSGDIAGKASFLATGKYSFLNPSDTDKFLELNGNPPAGGKSNTVASIESDWFAVLRFAPEGYVKDDEKIDADALLSTLKENNQRESEERRQKGYSALKILGWSIPPRYDRQHKRLEWGTLLRDEQSNAVYANVSTKMLGRSGYTNVVLVTSSPESVEKDLADFKAAMANFSYVNGEKYSDWKQGDKVAAYGLGALVVGGAAAAMTSKGGLKAIGLAVVAGLAALWAAIKRLFLGRKQESPR